MATSTKPPKTLQTTQSSTTVASADAAAESTLAAASTTTTSASLMLAFTEITGTLPSRLTKVLGLNPDSSLRKETAAQLSAGKCRRIDVDGLVSLRSHLDGLTSAQAVTWGITRADTADLCTEGNTGAKAQGAIARTRANFRFANDPGLMMLDHDGLLNGSLTL